MPKKRTPTDEEIEALAEQFRHLWRQGDVMRPWFRQHRDMLLGLVHGDWSWVSVGQALTKAGITYRTGKPWTAKWLQSDFSRAQIPLKGYRRGKRPSQDVSAPATVPVVPALRAPVVQPASSPRATSAPRFKPASFRIQELPPVLSEADRAEIERNPSLTFGLPEPKEPS